MPKYSVNVCRIAYGNRDIEITAPTKRLALKKAVEVAGNFLFSEHSSEYEAQSATLIKEPSKIIPFAPKRFPMSQGQIDRERERLSNITRRTGDR